MSNTYEVLKKLLKGPVHKNDGRVRKLEKIRAYTQRKWMRLNLRVHTYISKL